MISVLLTMLLVLPPMLLPITTGGLWVIEVLLFLKNNYKRTYLWLMEQAKDNTLDLGTWVSYITPHFKWFSYISPFAPLMVFISMYMFLSSTLYKIGDYLDMRFRKKKRKRNSEAYQRLLDKNKN